MKIKLVILTAFIALLVTGHVFVQGESEPVITDTDPGFSEEPVVTIIPIFTPTGGVITPTDPAGPVTPTKGRQTWSPPKEGEFKQNIHKTYKFKTFTTDSLIMTRNRSEYRAKDSFRINKGA